MLLADANVPSHDVIDSYDSQRPLSVPEAEVDVCDLNETENFERYITGKDKFFRCYLCMSSSDSSQALSSNVQRPTPMTQLLLPSSSLFLDLRMRSAKS